MRLFIAVNFPASVQRSIEGIGSELERAGIPARWVPRSGLHLTLKFLGDMPQSELGQLKVAIEEVASASGPFPLRFGQVGAFPSPRSPRVIWVGLDSGPRLRLLHDALDRRMAEFGVQREARPFRPHVTVGRTNRNAGPGDLREFERHARGLSLNEEVEVGRIDLMRSRLLATGAEYIRLSSARLGAV
jgi:2'-5' RNA ligase